MSPRCGGRGCWWCRGEGHAVEACVVVEEDGLVVGFRDNLEDLLGGDGDGGGNQQCRTGKGVEEFKSFRLGVHNVHVLKKITSVLILFFLFFLFLL